MDWGSIAETVLSTVAGSTLGKVSLVVAGVSAVLALALFAVHAYKAWKEGKLTASREHQDAVQDEAAYQATLDSLLDQLDEAQVSAMLESAEALKAAEALEQQIADLKQKHAAALAAVAEAKDWGDLDAILDGDSTGRRDPE
jgi:hypothetical protein